MENNSDIRNSVNLIESAEQNEDENRDETKNTSPPEISTDMNMTDLKQEISNISQLEDKTHDQVIEHIGQISHNSLSPCTKSVLHSIEELVKSNPLAIQTTDATEIDPINYEDLKQFRKYGQYVSKLKYCMRFYSNVNEKMLVEITKMKKVLLNSKDNIDTYKVEEMQELESKIKKYDDQLKKMSNKYPCLNDTSLNLENMHAEVMKLERMKQQYAELKSQLDGYKGLKADLTQARMQLALHKNQFEKLNAMYN